MGQISLDLANCLTNNLGFVYGKGTISVVWAQMALTVGHACSLQAELKSLELWQFPQQQHVLTTCTVMQSRKSFLLYAFRWRDCWAHLKVNS